MGKIDFDADSAPFSGSIMPTIEDVAALVETEGRVEVEAAERAGEAAARKTQAILMPTLLLVGLFILGGMHFWKQSGGTPKIQKEEKTGSVFALSNIPYQTARDVRFIDRVPSGDTVDYILRMGAIGYKIILVYNKDLYAPDPRLQREGSGITLYPVAGGALPGDGVLLDGLRWYPIAP